MTDIMILKRGFREIFLKDNDECAVSVVGIEIQNGNATEYVVYIKELVKSSLNKSHFDLNALSTFLNENDAINFMENYVKELT